MTLSLTSTRQIVNHIFDCFHPFASLPIAKIKQKKINFNQIILFLEFQSKNNYNLMTALALLLSSDVSNSLSLLAPAIMDLFSAARLDKYGKTSLIGPYGTDL